MKETMPDRVRTLEQRHRSLSQQVDRLERRAYLTPFEQRQITDLKKLKLMAKDELFALKGPG
ncbi:MAG TPA: YdcH family protein [Polyangiaceae bacterium]|nr:YdcH family protein [Polyangiaceae bacterium]